MEEPSNFADQIEQVLRGTLEFEKLRATDSQLARRLLDGIRTYVNYIANPQQPLKLVDSTGFSLQSIQTVLASKGNIGPDSWDRERLFRAGDHTLQDMVGVLLRVPELRKNLETVLGGKTPDGDKLALILKDWVNGEELTTIAARYFHKEGDDEVTALTKCGQNLFGKLAQTSSWGLNALLAITASDLSEDERKRLANLPSYVFYGVATDEAIALRLLGVPRRAATPLAGVMNLRSGDALPTIRQHLTTLSDKDWNRALGPVGTTYRKVWQIIDGTME
jgi:hypothetical protein